MITNRMKQLKCAAITSLGLSAEALKVIVRHTVPGLQPNKMERIRSLQSSFREACNHTVGLIQNKEEAIIEMQKTKLLSEKIGLALTAILNTMRINISWGAVQLLTLEQCSAIQIAALEQSKKQNPQVPVFSLLYAYGLMKNAARLVTDDGQETSNNQRLEYIDGINLANPDYLDSQPNLMQQILDYLAIHLSNNGSRIHLKSATKVTINNGEFPSSKMPEFSLPIGEALNAFANLTLQTSKPGEEPNKIPQFSDIEICTWVGHEQRLTDSSNKNQSTRSHPPAINASKSASTDPLFPCNNPSLLIHTTEQPTAHVRSPGR